MIITIDGPAGAGKSTVAKRLAETLGFAFLDTGAMYRAMALVAMKNKIDLTDNDQLVLSCRNADLNFSLETILLDGIDISSQIRSPEVTRNVKYVADHPEIRQILVNKQRELAQGQNIVCEGRDQGTVAFPHAECKFFLTASADERAKRRFEELEKRGIETDLDSIRKDQDRRDEQDRSRPVGALLPAEDAIEFCTDGLSIDEVVEQLKQKVLAIANTAN